MMQRSVEWPRRCICFPRTCQLYCDTVEVPSEVPALGAAERGLSGTGQVSALLQVATKNSNLVRGWLTAKEKYSVSRSMIDMQNGIHNTIIMV